MRRRTRQYLHADTATHLHYTDAMERVARKFHGFSASDESDRDYYLSLTPQQRLEILLELIARHRDTLNETAARFKRVYRVTKLQRG